MAPTHYVMFDQARNKVPQIMREGSTPEMVSRPSWLALGLLVVAFNLIAASSA